MSFAQRSAMVRSSAAPTSMLVTPLTFQAFTQCDGDRSRHGLTGQFGEFSGQQARFAVLDVETHSPPR